MTLRWGYIPFFAGRTDQSSSPFGSGKRPGFVTRGNISARHRCPRRVLRSTPLKQQNWRLKPIVRLAADRISDQSSLNGCGHRLGTVGDFEFTQNVLDMVLDG